MTEIITLENGSELWEQTASYAEQCSWRAGAELAKEKSGRPKGLPLHGV